VTKRLGVLICVLLCSSLLARAQAPTAVVNGQVRDSSGAAIPKAEVLIINDDTNVHYATETNEEGIYSVPNLPPGRYRIQVSKQAFKTIVRPDLVLHAQDAVAISVVLPVGATSETVTVEGGAPLVNTENATVSTVIDRQFAENLPLNGRSFQSLIYLTPGVVVVPSSTGDSGQFTVNGQRAASNYWMVDGVSANIGVSAGDSPGNGFGGTLGAFSSLGGTNSLVSVDALQEFRIQTSTFAPEFGRTPGGQISIVTRSGTNQFHGTVFDYFRNDVLDANEWFGDYDNLPKPEERQNDFGGTLGGPIIKDKTFFFFSYEGLRLRLPEVEQSTVPDLNARESALSAVQPYLNAYPLPNGPDLGNGIAQFNASFSNAATLDAYSLRVDHKLTNKFSLFGRYNYSPSSLDQRGAAQVALSDAVATRITVQTGTAGVTWAISPTIADDLRFNYSHVNAYSSGSLDDFAGAIPLGSLPLPSPFTEENSQFIFRIIPLVQGQLQPGKTAQNIQRQINLVDAVSLTKGPHAFKIGVDYRRLTPITSPASYAQAVYFDAVSAVEIGQGSLAEISSSIGATLLFQNFGAYAQDTWRIDPRLTLTYGLRWDLDFPPSSLSGPSIPAVTGYNLTNLSQLAIAPAGTSPYKTTYGNVAPRIGAAYQLNQNQSRQSVLRAGFGVFYDLVESETGSGFSLGNPFFGYKAYNSGIAFPLGATESAPPIVPSTGNIADIYAFNPNLKLPYTLEWNVSFEQAIGREQTITASYIGSSGRRLLQSAVLYSPATNPNIGNGIFIDNTASSNYNSLQIQFQRRMSHGLQVLASYTLAHSIDDGSAGSDSLLSNVGVPGSPNANWGPSDFDIRHTLTAAATYDIMTPKTGAVGDAILHGWSLESMLFARSAPPVDVNDGDFFTFNGGIFADIRPDLVPGQPLYLYGRNCASVMQSLGNLAPGQGCPGGKGFNPNAFQDPPTDPTTGNPARQGNVPRNFLRGFGATQWDFAVHRDFPIRENIKLQFRAEMFNVLNHPNFGQPNGNFYSPAFGGPSGFGLSTSILAHYLDSGGIGSNLGGGAFDPLYQIGGPRSVQLALKLFF
jgi:hypothetical protein